jgi:23S rRNA (cytidine1920-2'-O)/16S rRNA (cytidine1409-2'-O)-methyltransferase
VTNRKLRLDVALVERGLSVSRELSRALIMSGEVRVDGQVVLRPSATVSPGADLLVAEPPPYVSRGGYKLAHALDAYHLDVEDIVALDVGASTGGFTDVLLQRHARRVYALDVGHGQLAWKIRQNPRVVTIEHTNVRFLESLPEPIDAAVIDVSFISLRLVIPPVARLLKPTGWIVALIKPQFEAGRGQVGKGGVVRDVAVHREVLELVLSWALDHDLAIAGCTVSPITGPAGNREFLALFYRAAPGVPFDVDVSAFVDTVFAVPETTC